MTLRLGVDVGGTFTDLFLHDASTGRTWIEKVPSTPSDQSIGVVDGIERIAARAGIEPRHIAALLHGTTVATNAVLERRGARVGLIVSRGFRHILYLADAWTPGPLFGFMIYDKPEPLVELEDVREIPERIAATGEIITPLDPGAVRAAIIDLADSGVQAVTVSLLNAFANPEHERRVAEIAAEVAPQLPLFLSSEVLPEFREYERTVTTVVNAYVAPPVGHYLSNLRQKLHRKQIGAPLQVVRSDGGLMSIEAACAMPVNTVLSGPAGGVSGAAFAAERAGVHTILTFDMGGTSTDVAVCRVGSPEITRETRVGDFPVRAPAVDVASIGAGGGSIAYVADATGALRVGPESAGADPGPACYARGGAEATVTDANVVLGHLPPHLLGGAMALDAEAAEASIRPLARRLGLDIEAAALGIVQVVNERMLGALRLVTVQRGRAGSDFALVSFGGAGGLHANALATLLGCYPVIVPNQAGVLSALGFVASDVTNELSRALFTRTADVQPHQLEAVLADLEAEAHRWLDAEGVPGDEQRIEFSLDMRYEKQGFEIPVELLRGESRSLDREGLASRFGREHKRLYGFELEEGAEIVCVRARAIGHVHRPVLEAAEAGPRDPAPAQTGEQAVWSQHGWQRARTYARSELRTGMVIDGYAIVEQYDATTVVLPGHAATVDPWQNLMISVTAPA